MDEAITELRAFNRFFTHSVGALDASFLGTEMSLPEARLLYEIANREEALASDVQTALGMDPAYVSRVVARFERRGWIVRERAQSDARRRPIALTDQGRAAFRALDLRQHAEVEAKLRRLGPSQRAELVRVLRAARRLLGPNGEVNFTIREFRTGDIGVAVARQAILYAETYGWGRPIEINMSEVATAFLRNFKPGRDQCWIGEIDGQMAGSILITDEGDGLSRLRLLYVEPFAQGLGLGNALVSTCLGFARSAGYARVTLWTHTVLTSARRIYAGHGFRLVSTAIHEIFGAPVQGETWELDLAT